MSKSEKKYTISFDFDGCLSQSEKPILDAANLTLQKLGYQKVITKSELTSYSILNGIILELTNDKLLAQEIRDYWFRPEILQLAPPNPVIVDLFSQLNETKEFSLNVITTRPHNCRLCTLDSLSEYITNIDWEEKLFLRSPSDPMSGGMFKVTTAIELGTNQLIDDGPTDICLFREMYPKCGLLYINQPWNSDHHDPEIDKLRISLDDPVELFLSRVLPSTRTSMPR